MAMTTREAAKKMGCTRSHVLNLIAAGRMTARRVPLPYGCGYYLDVSQASVDWYEERVSRRGWPRGKKRRGK
jgi:excisionase family DNA binding protein